MSSLNLLPREECDVPPSNTLMSFDFFSVFFSIVSLDCFSRLFLWPQVLERQLAKESRRSQKYATMATERGGSDREVRLTLSLQKRVEKQAATIRKLGVRLQNVESAERKMKLTQQPLQPPQPPQQDAARVKEVGDTVGNGGSGGSGGRGRMITAPGQPRNKEMEHMVAVLQKENRKLKKRNLRLADALTLMKLRKDVVDHGSGGGNSGVNSGVNSGGNSGGKKRRRKRKEGKSRPVPPKATKETKTTKAATDDHQLHHDHHDQENNRENNRENNHGHHTARTARTTEQQTRYVQRLAKENARLLTRYVKSLLYMLVVLVAYLPVPILVGTDRLGSLCLLNVYEPVFFYVYLMWKYNCEYDQD